MIQTRQYRAQRKTLKKNDCGFSGNQNSTPQQNCPVKNGKMQQMAENGTLRPVVQRKTKQQHKQNELSGRHLGRRRSK